MKFVALVSGGKDSCYNILHCLKNEHELVALANLCPKKDNIQELDSFMFQTVGHDIVSLYGKCCGVPLFRESLDVNPSYFTDLNYIPEEMMASEDVESSKNLDEIEILFKLLSKVKHNIPDLEAVSVGAILSSYQRVRVENVCNRLGLTVLSYLWQSDQLELMNQMCLMSNDSSKGQGSGHLDARLIKVASIGLNKSHLNKSLPEILPTMIKLNHKYEVNICGEGGEFETMVLDAPFFKHGYLQLVDVTYNENNDNDTSNGVFNAQLVVEFKERTLSDGFLQSDLGRLPQNPILESNWSEFIIELKNKCTDKEFEESKHQTKDMNTYKPKIYVNKFNKLMYISNLTSQDDTNSATIEEQTNDVFTELDKILQENAIMPSQIIYSSLILSDMQSFGQVNKIYNNWFNTLKWGPLPPSRACVGSKQLGSKLIQLSVIVDLESKRIKEVGPTTVDLNKDGLHVQGRSYWAPNNIGPYSQAIWLNSDYQNKVSYISGQIALIPKSMEMVGNVDGNTKILSQVVLSLKHFHTIKKTIGTLNQLFMTCFTTDVDAIPIIVQAWSLYCSGMSQESELWFDKIDEPIENLIIVKISQLPRNAICEWGGIACKELDVEYIDDDSDDDVEYETTQFTDSLQNLNISDIAQNDITVLNRSQGKRIYSTLFLDDVAELKSLLEINQGHLTIYFNPNDLDVTAISGTCHVEWYPVTAVFDYQGRYHKFAVHWTH